MAFENTASTSTSWTTALFDAVVRPPLERLEARWERKYGPLQKPIDEQAHPHLYQPISTLKRDITQPPPATAEMLSHRDMVF